MSDRSKSNNTPLILGIVLALIGLFVIICSGSPFDTLHMLNEKDILPPIWIWCATLLVLKFLEGYALGCLLTLLSTKRLCGNKEIKAYQGGIFFIAYVFLTLAHYPILFIAERPLAAVLISAAAFISSVICFIIWTKTAFLPCAVMALNTIWAFYVTFVSARVLINL